MSAEHRLLSALPNTLDGMLARVNNQELYEHTYEGKLSFGQIMEKAANGTKLLRSDNLITPDQLQSLSHLLDTTRETVLYTGSTFDHSIIYHEFMRETDFSPAEATMRYVIEEGTTVLSSDVIPLSSDPVSSKLYLEYDDASYHTHLRFRLNHEEQFTFDLSFDDEKDKTPVHSYTTGRLPLPLCEMTEEENIILTCALTKAREDISTQR